MEALTRFAWVGAAIAGLSACSMFDGKRAGDIGIDPIYQCQGKDTAANTCDESGTGPMQCHVHVSGEGVNMKVTPFTLRVPRPPDPANPSRVRPAFIILHADEADYRFTNADGPPELKNHPQFQNGAPMNNGKEYRILFLNGPLGPRGVYYTIGVRKGEQVSRCDPLIYNEGF